MIQDYLHQVGQLELPTGANIRGETTFADPVAVACRVQHRVRKIVTDTGAEILSDGAEVFFLPNQPVVPGAYFTYEGRRWSIDSVYNAQGAEGLMYRKAVLGG